MKKQSVLATNHWCTYRAEVADGKIVAMRPFEEDPDPSPIGEGIIDALECAEPDQGADGSGKLVEDGPGANTHLRGKEAFVEVSWDRVEELVPQSLAGSAMSTDQTPYMQAPTGGQRRALSSCAKPVEAVPELQRRVHQFGFHLFLRGGGGDDPACSRLYREFLKHDHELAIRGAGGGVVRRRLWRCALEEWTD